LGCYFEAKGLSAHFGAGRAVAGGDLVATLSKAGGLIHARHWHGEAARPTLSGRTAASVLVVMEIVNFSLETALLRHARSLGCRTLNGGGTTVIQAVRAFQLITGLEPDAERMRRHFLSM
jgi:shikimate dehydrogenase